MNVRMLYVWPNLKNLTFHLTELPTAPVQTVIATLNRLYGQPRIVQLADVSDDKIEQLVNLENAFVEARKEQVEYKPLHSTSRNAATLSDFIKFCHQHPSLRFWQALRNWANVNFIYTSESLITKPYVQDTFHREGK